MIKFSEICDLFHKLYITVYKSKINVHKSKINVHKLKTRNVLEKSKNKSFYRVTDTGFKYMWLEICSREHFKNPMISKSLKNGILKNAEQPSKIEEAYTAIDTGLSLLTQQLAIIC